MTNESLEKCKAQIKKHEGLRLNAYKDTLGFWTIGYGHFLGAKPVASKITKDEAEALFEGDFYNAWLIAEKNYLAKINGIGEAREAVIINMAFNIGNKLREFKQLKAAIEQNDFERAATAMLSSRWAKQVGKRAIELSLQMRTGEWQK